MTTRYTKGRCWKCNKAFQWQYHKGRELYNTPCPFCDGKLYQTAHYLKSCQWYQLWWTGGAVQWRVISHDEVRDCCGRDFLGGAQ